MRKIAVAILLGLFVSLLAAGQGFAQGAGLTLKLSRDWGYGGFSGDIQGLFTMHVTGPSDLARVEFYIDSTKIGEVDKTPFNLQFSTDDYPLGVHQLHVVGYSTSGQKYSSNIITSNFVPAQNAMKFILPLLGVILAAVVISALIPFIASRRKNASIPLGVERNYGVSGGAICPKCHRPFALPFLSMNLGFSKLTFCPHCGKLILTSRQPIEKLRQAEKDELSMAQPIKQIAGETDEDKLRKELEESKYKD
jgi:hypothetical protein